MKFLICSLFFLAFLVGQAKPVDVAEVAAHRALIKQDIRLGNIGFHILKANAPYCKDRKSNTGWILHDIRQYGNVEAARAAFGFAQPVQVAGVASRGPAEAAGLRADDGIVRVTIGKDHVDFSTPPAKKEKNSYARLLLLLTALETQLLSQPEKVTVTFQRDGNKSDVSLRPALTCASNFQIDVSDTLDAGADGNMVSVTQGMAAYVPDDAEFAAVVAHEVSHNLLRHRQRFDKAKVSRGLGRLFGKNKAQTLAAEAEADRLSVWLMANAGYDPKAAVRFWTRYGKQHGQGIFSDGTHYRWKRRVAMLEEEILGIDTAKQASKDIAAALPPPLLVSLPAQGQ